MKVTGIIAECNPLHNGHVHLLQTARKMTGADYTVIVLSGDFVQRGEPAIIDKYERTRALLSCGADLVLELPVYAACGGADYFARGAVSLLDALGVVTDLCFGSETGEIGGIMSAARLLAEENGTFDDLMKQYLASGLSYPAAREKSLRTLLSDEDALPLSPNDLLGTEYCKGLLRMGSVITPHAIPRIELLHASDLRKSLLESKTVQNGIIPPAMSALMDAYLKDHALMSCRELSDLLLYSLWQAEDLQAYADVSRELSDAIRGNLMHYKDWPSFCSLLHTKNYTYSRISRCLLHILLGITGKDMDAFEKAGFAGYCRILGMRKEASPLLHAISENSSLTLLSRLARDGRTLPAPFDRMLELDIRAAQLYELVSRTHAESAGEAVSELSRPIIIL